VFLRALVVELAESGALRPELEDVDIVAQTIWATVHGAAALDLTLRQNAMWLDMKPRPERFRATLELIVRGLMRKPDEQLAKMARALGSPEAVAPNPQSEPTPPVGTKKAGVKLRGASSARGAGKAGGRKKSRK